MSFLADIKFDEPINSRTKDDAKALVKKLHAAGWHHHDLWEGNFVANETGQLSLIDFESAVYKGKEQCTECRDQEWLSWNDVDA